MEAGALLNHPWLRTTDLGELRCYDTEVTRFREAQQLILGVGNGHLGDLDSSDGHGQDAQSAPFLVTSGGKWEKGEVTLEVFLCVR